MTDDARQGHARAWLAKAREDLQGARLILRGPMPSYGLVGFLAQQAAEKALKAVLVRHGIRFDRTHNLEELLRLVEGVVPGTHRALQDATELTPSAVSVRYPGLPPVDQEEAGRRLRLGERVVSMVAPWVDA